MEREPNTIYVASLSYGKDSIAMLEAIKQLGYPLDRIVHAEVWATQDIPADLPPMMEFKAKADEKILQMYGIPVEHICAMKKPKPEDDALDSQSVNVERERESGISKPTKTSSTTFSPRETTSETSRDSHSQVERMDGANISSTTEKLTYEDIFYRTLHHRKKSNSSDLHSQNVQVERERERNYGFPFTGAGMGWCHELKKTPLSITNLRIPHQPGTMVQLKSQAPASTDFQSQSTEGIGVQVSSETFSDTALAQGGKINIVQYLGIAADEPKRIERHQVKGKMLPLVDIGWSEAYCRKWCEEHDLLSPIYTTMARGGCWFCHNQGVDQLRQLRKNYPDLWALLLKWDLDSPTTFHADGHTVHDFDKRFRCEDEGIIDPNVTFRWAMISGEALATKQISMFREDER